MSQRSKRELVEAIYTGYLKANRAGKAKSWTNVKLMWIKPILLIGISALVG